MDRFARDADEVAVIVVLSDWHAQASRQATRQQSRRQCSREGYGGGESREIDAMVMCMRKGSCVEGQR